MKFRKHGGCGDEGGANNSVCVVRVENIDKW